MLHDAINNIKKIQIKLQEIPTTKQFPLSETYKLSSDFCQTTNEHIKRCQFFINDLCNKLSKFIHDCQENEKNHDSLVNAIRNYKKIIENPENKRIYEEFEYLNEKHQDLISRNIKLNKFCKIQLENSDFLKIEKQQTSSNDYNYDEEIINFLDSKIEYEGFSKPEEIENLENILEFLVGNVKEEREDTTTTS